ncbi:unnamed protein product [Miscanthus lutarioriparius]|uniref:Uncharacterized protein n=1 Tax=Miscanthus lutarioriparius TaxID=422564 RepID=A0A811QEA0_9POAL|nr:unnamed protein product [Miscanthus lutarioriparius]
MLWYLLTRRPQPSPPTTTGPAANKAGSSIDLCSTSTWVRMPPAALELPLRRLSDEQAIMSRRIQRRVRPRRRRSPTFRLLLAEFFSILSVSIPLVSQLTAILWPRAAGALVKGDREIQPRRRREEAAVTKQICTREEMVSWGRDQEVDPLDPRPCAAGALVEGDREIQGVAMVEPEVRPAWLFRQAKEEKTRRVQQQLLQQVVQTKHAGGRTGSGDDSQVADGILDQVYKSTNPIVFFCFRRSRTGSNQPETRSLQPVPLSIVFPASLDPETEHVNTADDINITENKGRPKTAVNKKRKLDNPAMNTRAKVSTTPDSSAMGTRSKRKLDI